MAETKNPSSKMNWDEEKKEFARKAFIEALDFMKKDNEMIGHFAIVTGALANYIKENPDEIAKFIRNSDNPNQSSNDTILAGSDFGSDLLGIIRDILLGDKEFILNLIKDLLKI